ncbi:MAG: NAD(P)H-dependent oxidoreductase [Desulfobacterales bacterium]|nr:NAD(P)H-dependent oxidoreductase [Desulfobacterales bacterium]
MYVLGIQGSPRKNGNSEYLLSSFLKECGALGAETDVIRPQALDIRPCRELIVCEKKGFCPIKDQMEAEGYEKIKQADVVILASPVFFYGVTAQVKVFIDRCQMFWGRKYKLKLRDPDRYTRQGFLLSVAASGGKRLFEGVDLTAKYFFDAVSADYSGSLTYKKVEDAGDIIVRPELEKEIKEAVSHLLVPMQEKRRVIFVSADGQCRSPAAAAFAKELTKDRVRVLATGLGEPGKPDGFMVRAMAESGLDIKYQASLNLDKVLEGKAAIKEGDQVILIGSGEELKNAGPFPGRCLTWEVPGPENGDYDSYLAVKDEISARVKQLAATL